MYIARSRGIVPSSPPVLRPSTPPGPAAAVDAEAFAAGGRDDASVCFAVQGAPPGSGVTRELGGGSIAIVTTLRGRVLSVLPDALEIDQDGALVRLRYLIPGGLSLKPLAGHVVDVRVSLVLHRDRSPTVDATIRDRRGGLLLWARDGALPSDRESQAVVVRVAQAPGGPPRLVFAARGALASVVAGGSAHLDAEGGLTGLALRVAGDDAAFVLARI